MKNERLYTPLQLRGITLQNRLFLEPGPVDTDSRNDPLNHFYPPAARENTSFIITGEKTLPTTDNWKSLLHTVHEAGGKMGLQLFYDKQDADSVFLPEEMKVQDIYHAVQAFADKALQVKEAGFDAVEIMSAANCLIYQFLSPYTNKRTDQWGGTFKKRLHFPLAIARHVRKYVGTDFPVIFQMPFTHPDKNGPALEEIVDLAEQMESAGMDMLNVGIGIYENQDPPLSKEINHHVSGIASGIRKHTSLAISASYRLHNLEEAGEILKDENIDMVSVDPRAFS